MKVRCIDDDVSTSGLTKDRIYHVIAVEDSAGKLYRIIDDNGDNHRYSEDFFEVIEEVKPQSKWDRLATLLRDEFGESIIDEGDENNPYDWWLTDVTVTDIIEFMQKHEQPKQLGR